MPTDSDDDYLNSLLAEPGGGDDENYLQELVSTAEAPLAEGGNPNISEVRAVIGPASPERSEAVVAGAMRGAADIGNTLLNAMDVPAQALETKFGTMGAPVAEGRERRDQSVRMYEEEYGDSVPATAGRIGTQTLLTAGPQLKGAELLTRVPGVKPALEILERSKFGRFIERAVQGGLIGGTTAAAISGGYEDPATKQALIGTGVGAVTNPVFAPVVTAGVRGLSGLGSWLKEKGVKVFRGLLGEAGEGLEKGSNKLLGQTGDDMADALRAVGQDPNKLPPEVQSSATKWAETQAATGAVDLDSVARKANMDALGLKSHESMATRDALKWAEERELAKTPAGSQLRADYDENNQILEDHLRKVAKDSGGNANTPYDASETLIKEAKAAYKDRSDEVSVKYTELESLHGQKAGITPDKLIKRLKQSESRALSEPGQGPKQGLLASVKAELVSLGVITKEGKPVLLKSGKPKTLTVAQANVLRKFINNSSAPSKNMRAIKEELIDAVDGSVEKAVGQDVFAPARAAHRKKIEDFEDDGTASKILRDITDDSIAPDHLIQRYVFGKSATAQDLKKLVDVLGPESNGIKELRQQVAEQILEASKGANGQLTYQALEGQLSKVGHQRLKVLFGEEGSNRYTSILAGLRDSTVVPHGAPVNFSNTGNELMRRIMNTSREMGWPIALLGAVAHEPTTGLALGAANVGGKVLSERAAAKATQAAVAQARGGYLNTPAGPVKLDPRVNRLIQSTTVPASVGTYNELTKDR